MTKGDPAGRVLRLLAEMRRERRNLARVAGEVETACELLRRRAPTFLELRGAGDLLHDYYTDLEKVFQLVAETLDGGIPEGERWHRRLLDAMTLDVSGVRSRVLDEETGCALDEYLRFRHLFRNLYGFDLDLDPLRELLEGLKDVDILVQADLDRFETTLAEVDRGTPGGP